jgi:hypothetical protein
MSTFYRSGWPVSSRRWEERLQGREFVREEPPSLGLNGVAPVQLEQLAPIGQTIATPGAKLFESHARTMCYSGIFCTKHFLCTVVLMSSSKH